MGMPVASVDARRWVKSMKRYLEVRSGGAALVVDPNAARHILASR